MPETITDIGSYPSITSLPTVDRESGFRRMF